MPEGYTHVKTGTMALRSSQVKTGYLLAFGAGTQGPDPLFFVQVYKKKRVPDWHTFAGRMHREKTGEFLVHLLENALSPVERAYAMGFLTHYATDSLMHPYVEFLTQSPGAPYGIASGHGYYEIALDSWGHQQDFGTPLVPRERSTPTPCIEELREIARLFSDCVYLTYQIHLPQKTVISAFKTMRFIRGALVSRFGVRRALFSLTESVMKLEPGYIQSHITPAAPLRPMPAEWQNPFTGQTYPGGARELLEQAVNLASDYLNAAGSYWDGTLSLQDCAALLGSRSYESGLESTDDTV